MAAALKFPQFLHRFDIRLLFASVDDTVPGSVISKNKRGYTPVAHLSDFIDDPAINWETEMKEANIIYGSVLRELSLGGKASMNQFGVGIGGGLSKVKKVSFHIEEVTAMGFINPMRLKLIGAVNAFRKKNRKQWRKLNRKCVVDYTYYASKVTFDFEKEGSFDLKGTISDKITVGGEANIKWKNDKSFVVTNNSKVPFGFTGWEV